MNDTLLEVRHLKKYFPVRRGLWQRTVNHVRAVDDVSFFIRAGETLGLVGESGCGKTTVGRTLLRLVEPTGGTIHFAGQEITHLPQWAMRPLRGDMQIVFQDPYSSLNPRMTVQAIVEEGLIVHFRGKRRERREQVVQALARVGLDADCIDRYPHEFSGGQRQRICIARALVLNPRLVILDEPISALDVSIQAQTINLLNQLKRELKLTYLFISHDLSVVEYISDRVAVMYLGEIVEAASSEQIYRQPRHPYTRALLSSIPTSDPRNKRNRIVLAGDVPSPIDPPRGCRFHPRCPLVMEICRREAPPPREIAGHWVRCHADEATSPPSSATGFSLLSDPPHPPGS